MTMQICACGHEPSDLRCFQCGKLQAPAAGKFLLAYLRDTLTEELNLCTDEHLCLFCMIYFPAVLHVKPPSIAAIVALLPPLLIDRALYSIDVIRHRGL